eukprot:m51a1_g14563 hypothetical protein (278) ;mRNA; r:1041461-1046398
MAGSPSPESHPDVFLRITTANIVRGRPFEIVCFARADWMRTNRLERESIRNAGNIGVTPAMVEGPGAEAPDGYCNSSRLHLGGRVTIVFRIVSSEGLELARPATAPVVLHAKTSYKPSPRILKWKDSMQIVHVAPEMTESAEALAGYCNSSRLHLGGRVVVVFRLAGSDGSELARVATEPLMLHAKSNYVPVPRTFKWKDSAPRFAVGAAEEAERERGTEEVEQERSAEPLGAGETPEAREGQDDILLQIRALQVLQTDQLARIRALDMALRGGPTS